MSLPKKPLTAYAIFVKKVSWWNINMKARKEYIDVWGDNSNNDMMKELGTLWSTIEAEEKHYYEKLATEGKH